jgi:hypothetical protein
MKFRPQVLRVLPVVMLACGLQSAPAQAQFTQQGPKLVGTDVIGPASFQGRSVSLSADGNTAIIGGPVDHLAPPNVGNAAGAAWVFARSGSLWTQQAKLVGAGAVDDAQQGVSVSLSGDGNTAIVGGFRDNDFAGAAWVFTRSSGVWSQQAKLVAADAIGAAWEGWSVSLSADGKTPPSSAGPATTLASAPSAPRGYSRARAASGPSRRNLWVRA